jgi:hypothetical protein
LNEQYAEFLAPAAEWLPLINSGKAAINHAANRVVWTGMSEHKAGAFAAALKPVVGEEAQRMLAKLPSNPLAATQAIASTRQLAELGPALQSLKLVSTVGALASVVSVGVSCVGFALVLQRLSRIEGKLDEMMGKVESVKRAVSAIHDHQRNLSIARIRAAGDSLERAMAATTEGARRQLATEARSSFQEGRMLFAELWHAAAPCHQFDMPVSAGLEMFGRYATCAFGEIQAEFILGDEGAFRHAVASVSRQIDDVVRIDAAGAFRVRSDAACVLGVEEVVRFQGNRQRLIEGLREAALTAQWTARRVETFADDMVFARELGVEPYDLARIARAASGATVYLIGRPSTLSELRQMSAA